MAAKFSADLCSNTHKNAILVYLFVLNAPLRVTYKFGWILRKVPASKSKLLYSCVHLCRIVCLRECHVAKCANRLPGNRYCSTAAPPADISSQISNQLQ